MEVIMYAILAVFVVTRLYSSFGKISAEREVKAKAAEIREMIDHTVKVADHMRYVDEAIVTDVLAFKKRMADVGVDFSSDAFMDGAERAFEIIVHAFSECDLRTLKKLLSKDMFESLSIKLKARQSKGNKLEKTIVSMQSKALMKLEVVRGVILATVRFASEQINVVRDAEDTIISGDNNIIELVEDVWTFERRLSSDPNEWRVCSLG